MATALGHPRELGAEHPLDRASLGRGERMSGREQGADHASPLERTDQGLNGLAGGCVVARHGELQGAAIGELDQVLYAALAERARPHEHGPIVIATGPESGTYHAMGQGLKLVLEETGQFESVEVRPTDGSVEILEIMQLQQLP